MKIVIYRRQRVDFGEQSDTTCLVPKFACCVAGPSEFFIQRFSIESSRAASPGAVLQRATSNQAVVLSNFMWHGKDNNEKPHEMQTCSTKKCHGGVYMFSKV